MIAVSPPCSTPTATGTVDCLRCHRPFLTPTQDPAAVVECPRCGAHAPLGSLVPPAPSVPPRSIRTAAAVWKAGLAGVLALGVLGSVAVSLHRLRPDVRRSRGAAPAKKTAATEIGRVQEAVLQEARAAAELALGCPDWKSAQPLLLNGETLAPVLASYHAKHPWIPLRIDGSHQGLLATAHGHRVAHLIARSDRGSVLNLRLVDTPSGWKLDWEELVHARQFAWDQFHENRPASPVGACVLARRGSATPDFFTSAGLTPDTGIAVLLDGPKPGQPVMAIVPKASDLGRRFQRDLTWEHARPYRCLLRFADPSLYPPRVEITEFTGEGWE